MHTLTRISIALCLASACANGDAMCRVGGDCASGVCLADGTCAVLDAGEPDAGATPEIDAGSDAGMDDAGVIEIDAGPPPLCDDDATITAAELPLPIGEHVSLRVAFGAAVDTHGVDRADGTRLWDLEGPFASDEDRAYQRRALDGEWFADTFTSADYTFPLGADSELRGVFERSTEALLLVGIVSATDGLSRTVLSYDPPIAVWRFPLEEGASWEETTTVSGIASGLSAYYSETWSVAVDARGDIGTPDGVRTVLRVNTRITRTVGLAVTLHRRLSFVEACNGTIAQVFGADGDGTAEPTYASELWRVAP